MDNLKRKLAKKDESTAKKQIMLGAKFKSNGNGIRGERADLGMWTLLQFGRLHMQPKELQEGQLIDINEESG